MFMTNISKETFESHIEYEVLLIPRSWYIHNYTSWGYNFPGTA